MRISRSRTKAAALAAGILIALATAPALARPPSVADLDAAERAAGNRIDVATRVGESVFATTWPVQVSQISANEYDSHLILGIRMWGVKFHRPITRREFVDEAAGLIEAAFAAAPNAEEVDLWTSVPIEVGKGVIVNGDLAKPTSRTVFSLTVRRGEGRDAVAGRALDGAGVYWDEEWARTAFKNEGA